MDAFAGSSEQDPPPRPEEVPEPLVPIPPRPDGNECTICLREMSAQEEHVLECTHKAHSRCTISMADKCPVHLCSIFNQEICTSPSPDSEKCIICFQEIPEDVNHILSCGHKTHKSCIDMMADLDWDRCTACFTKISQPHRKKCSICSEEIAVAEDERILECGHKFHVTCIELMSNLDWKSCAECSQGAQAADLCTICLVATNADDVTLTCGHKFHTGCVVLMTDANGCDGCLEEMRKNQEGNENEVEECSICLEAMNSASVLTLPCGRELHHECRNAMRRMMAEPEPQTQYSLLMHLECVRLVTNTQRFECSICLTDYAPGEGVILKDCLHIFCKGCLAQTIEHSKEAEVKCPHQDANYSCQSVLQQREIKALVPQHIFEQHLARGVAQAESRIANTFHCKTPDCSGWCVLANDAKNFGCPVCSHVNCLSCQAIHDGLDCQTYREDPNPDIDQSRAVIEGMVNRREAMRCPTCQVVVEKTSGCDGLICTWCMTAICWATRGPRWGPKGFGDTSGGCRCLVNGQKCHPNCENCH